MWFVSLLGQNSYHVLESVRVGWKVKIATDITYGPFVLLHTVLKNQHFLMFYCWQLLSLTPPYAPHLGKVIRKLVLRPLASVGESYHKRSGHQPTPPPTHNRNLKPVSFPCFLKTFLDQLGRTAMASAKSVPHNKPFHIPSVCVWHQQSWHFYQSLLGSSYRSWGVATHRHSCKHFTCASHFTVGETEKQRNWLRVTQWGLEPGFLAKSMLFTKTVLCWSNMSMSDMMMMIYVFVIERVL